MDSDTGRRRKDSLGPRPEPRRQTIQAAVLSQPGRPLKIEALELEAPRPDEVLLRIVASGSCHTDIDGCASGASGAVVLFFGQSSPRR